MFHRIQTVSKQLDIEWMLEELVLVDRSEATCWKESHLFFFVVIHFLVTIAAAKMTAAAVTTVLIFLFIVEYNGSQRWGSTKFRALKVLVTCITNIKFLVGKLDSPWVPPNS